MSARDRESIARLAGCWRCLTTQRSSAKTGEVADGCCSSGIASSQWFRPTSRLSEPLQASCSARIGWDASWASSFWAAIDAPGDISRYRLRAVLADRSSSRADTLIRLRGPDYQIRHNSAGTFSIFSLLVGSVEEQSLLFPDGWIAVTRIEPYRVEWRSPGGGFVRGPPLPWEAPRSDAREKQAYLERLRRRAGPDAKLPDVPWADRLAPIRQNALLATPEGNLLILRAQWSRVGFRFCTAQFTYAHRSTSGLRFPRVGT